MLRAYLPQVLEALAIAGSVLAFRAFPFVVFFTATPRTGLAKRFGWAVAYLVLVWTVSAVRIFNPFEMVGAFAYTGAWGLLVGGLAARRTRGPAAKAAVFLVAALGFVVAPAVLAPALSATALVIGWEAWLKTYSYCVEVSRGRPGDWRKCLFFLLVDPTFVYRDRHEGDASTQPALRTLRRVLAGAAFFALGCGLDRARRDGSVVDAGLSVAAIYFQQTALGSFRIGLMRVAGYAVPEQYVRPLAALSPFDFWRRWNTYLGDWARDYLFYPSARWLRRPLGRNATAGAVLATFAGVGAVHDAYRSAVLSRFETTGTAFFVSMGMLAVVWEAASRLQRRAGRPSSLGSWIPRIAAWTTLAFCARYWVRAFIG